MKAALFSRFETEGEPAVEHEAHDDAKTISQRHRHKTAEQRVREQKIRCAQRGVDRETDQDERSGLPGVKRSPIEADRRDASAR
jgi:hypothetical protein